MQPVYLPGVLSLTPSFPDLDLHPSVNCHFFPCSQTLMGIRKTHWQLFPDNCFLLPCVPRDQAYKAPFKICWEPPLPSTKLLEPPSPETSSGGCTLWNEPLAQEEVSIWGLAVWKLECLALQVALAPVLDSAGQFPATSNIHCAWNDLLQLTAS